MKTVDITNRFGKRPQAAAERPPGLTPREWDVLRLWREHYERTGLPPTIRGVSQTLGLAGNRYVFAVVRRLVACGFLVAAGDSRVKCRYVPKGYRVVRDQE